LHDPQQALAAKNPQSALPSLSFGNEPEGAFVAPRAPVSTAPATAAASQGGYGGSMQQPNQQGMQQPQNGAQGYNNQQGQNNQNQSNEPEEPEYPRKHKGKMVLEYADGSRRVRPPLGQLFKSNPKMAIYCLKEETPVVLQAWWSQSRKIAPTMGTYVGFGIAMLISLAWFFILPLLENPLQNALADTFISSNFISITMMVFTYGSVGIAAIASIMLLLSALNDRRKAAKRYNGLNNLVKEKDWITILRFVPIALFYGPIFFIVLIFLLIAGLFSFIKAVGRAT